MLHKRKGLVTFLTHFLKIILGIVVSLNSWANQNAGFTIYSWNVSGKLDQPAVRDQIVNMQPDIILVTEATDDIQVTLLKTELETHLGGTWEVLTNNLANSSKLAWLSRYPLSNPEVIKTDPIQKSLLKAEITLGGETFTLFGLHAVTAANHSKHREESDEFIRILGTLTGHQQTIVVGDFNSRSILDGAVTSIDDSTYDTLGFRYPTTYSTDNFMNAGYLDSWRFIKKTLANVEATKMSPPSGDDGSNLNERIDYAWVSTDLRERLLDAGIHSETTNEMSDHKPIWVRIAAPGITTQGGTPVDHTPTIQSSTLASDNRSLEIQFTEGVYANPNLTGALTPDHFELTFEPHANGQATGCHITGVNHTAGADTVTIALSVDGTPNGNETIKIHLAGNNPSAQPRKMSRHIYNAAGLSDHWARFLQGRAIASTIRTNYYPLNLVTTTTAPTVTIEQASFQTDPATTSPIFFTVTFSEPVIDFTADKLTLSGNTGATSVTTISVTGTTYTIAVSGATNNGTLTVHLGAEVVHDAQGHANQASTSQDNSVTYVDPYAPSYLTYPSVISMTGDRPLLTQANQIIHTVTFNEAVTGVDVSDFDLLTEGLTSASINSVTGTGNRYQVTVDTGTGNGSLQVRLRDDDSIQNLNWMVLGGLGLENGNAVGPKYTLDKTPPTVTFITGADHTVTLVFNEAIKELTRSYLTLTDEKGNPESTSSWYFLTNDSITWKLLGKPGKYLLKLNTNIVDLAGNPLVMKAEYLWDVPSPTTLILPTPTTSSHLATPSLILPNFLTLWVTVVGPGRVQSYPAGIDCSSADQECKYLFETASDILLTPIPEQGSSFISWGGHKNCVDGKVFMISSMLCIAFFGPR